MTGPGFIIDVSKIGRELLEPFFIDGNTFVVSGSVLIMPGVHFVAELFLGIQANTDLVKERAETIVFEKLLIVRRVIIHAIQWFLKAFGNQSPPAVALAKGDRPIHGLFPALQ